MITKVWKDSTCLNGSKWEVLWFASINSEVWNPQPSLQNIFLSLYSWVSTVKHRGVQSTVRVLSDKDYFNH